MPILTTVIDTPVGKLLAGATDDGLCLLDFAHREKMAKIKERVRNFLKTDFEEGAHPLFTAVRQQLDAYFKGDLKKFDLPIILCGSDFQQQVWKALLQVPYGETRSYKQQSIAMRKPDAIRAIASANGDNAINIIVPCHRIIGANGSLTGYGGGIDKKRWLLDHEREWAGRATQRELF